MLTTALDIPHEDAIGGFRACLDPELVLRACREQLVKVAGPIRDTWNHAGMIEALYHPGRHLRVVYALLTDPDTPRSRFWPEGQLVYLHAPLRKPMSRRGTTLKIDGVAVEAYCFPNDRRLRELRKFAGRAAAVASWQEWLDSAGCGVQLDGATLQRLLVRYVPEQKWVIRLRAEGTATADGTRSKHRIAVRCASPDACTELARRHTALAEGLGTGSEVFRVPAVVGMSDEKYLLAVEWIRGDSLLTALRNGDADEVMAGMASRLRRFHATPVDGLDSVSVADLVDRGHVAAEDISSALPELATEVRPLATELRRRLAAVDGATPVTLHNDFHWDQVSIKRDRFALFDLERVGLGDELIDVANLATQIRLLAHRPEIGVAGADAERWRSLFLDHWKCGTGGDIDGDRFACYATVTALDLARGMMRHLRPGWPELAKKCVEIAACELDSADAEAWGS